MGLYEEEKPLLPWLHRCSYCKKRLNRSMQTVSEWCGEDYTDWYCSKECAKKELQERRRRSEMIDELNDEIKGGL